MHSALARPNVRYRLIADGAEILNLAAVTDVATRGGEIFAGDLIPISLHEERLAVEGRVGHPGAALADATGLVLLVNGRLVSDKIMVRAVREGYDSMLKDREFPVGYISLSLPADEVDVNVHPQKSEVRFRHPDQVFAVVRGAVLAGVRSIRRPMPAQVVEPVVIPAAADAQPTFVREAALPSASQPDVRDVWPIQRAAPVVVPPQTARRIEEFPRYKSPGVGSVAPKLFGEQTALYAVQEEAAVDSDFRFSELRYVGQVLECYLLCEHNEKLVVVDMHAAHERVARALTVQKLLIPERVHLTAEQVVSLMEQSDLLRELAFEVSQDSDTEVLVTGVPSAVSHLDCTALVKEFAAEPISAGWRERLEERIDHIAARLACHASVRSGDILKKEEAYALFAQLDEATLAGACPHGRPVVAEFPRQIVERWFGRDR
jgi:DNA mismatch repair protein MutL